MLAYYDLRDTAAQSFGKYIVDPAPGEPSNGIRDLLSPFTLGGTRFMCMLPAPFVPPIVTSVTNGTKLP